jgi:hypothetical protein
MERALRADDDIVARTAGSGLDLLPLVAEGPLGSGLGTQSQVVSLSQAQATGIAVLATEEDGRRRLVVESGVLGLLALALLTSIPLSLSLHWPQAEARIAAFTFAPVTLYSILAGGWIYDHVATAFLWMLIARWIRIVSDGESSRAAQWRRREPLVAAAE